jgi:hypothetical protein
LQVNLLIFKPFLLTILLVQIAIALDSLVKEGSIVLIQEHNLEAIISSAEFLI